MKLRFRDTESCDPVISHYWDSVMVNRMDASGGYADWVLADPINNGDPSEQGGGLRARMGLHTAILICLFTDKRLPEGMESPAGDADPRGWWGDSVKLDDEPDNAEMGSLLWTLERGTLSEEVAKLARDYADEALQVLVDQGAVAVFEIETEIDQINGFLGLIVRAFSQAGVLVYDQKFQALWDETRNPARMNYNYRVA